MEFALSEIQQMVQETAKAFADNELLPIAAEIDKSGQYPASQVQKLAELGFLGVAVQERWGGAGFDNLSYAIAMEEISRGCASTGVIMSVNNSLVCDPIKKFGNDEQKAKWLRPLAQGKRLGCFALSEPGSGSDAAGMRMTAIRDGDDYVVNGTKNWITNGKEADVCILIAHHDPVERHRGISAFIVDRRESPYKIGKVEDKLGIKGSSTTSLVFEDIRVPVANRLGEEGMGFKVAMSTLDGGRIGIAAQALGIARIAFEEALAYSRERSAFGKVIGDFGAIREMLADMATEIDAARLLIWRAAVAKDHGENYGSMSAMAKLYASEMSARVCHKALQIHGGYGYVKEYNAERHVRDARITEIYEGTSEIQRLVIARETQRRFATGKG
ncbi:MAG TPA: acyl-CoA dehydrogenase [Myxococcales bacterium]|nr:acyl-CoA dehydrogenase [Myxococcales bacterium]HAN30990.1 acyl-CoA dehydrogenase [Myxococcales bacterium]